MGPKLRVLGKYQPPSPDCLVFASQPNQAVWGEGGGSRRRPRRSYRGDGQDGHDDDDDDEEDFGQYGSGSSDGCCPPVLDEELFITPPPDRHMVVWRPLGAGPPATIKMFRFSSSSSSSSSRPAPPSPAAAAPSGGAGGLLQALWCRFESLGRCLCVLKEPELVAVLGCSDGSSFEVALPCQAARLWALGGGGGGLLIQQRRATTTTTGGAGSSSSHHNTPTAHPYHDDYDQQQRRRRRHRRSSGGSSSLGGWGDHSSGGASMMMVDEDNNNNGGVSFMDLMDDDEEEDDDDEEEVGPMPSLFSLLHPLDEVKPVAIAPPPHAAPDDDDDDGDDEDATLQQDTPNRGGEGGDGMDCSEDEEGDRPAQVDKQRRGRRSRRRDWAEEEEGEEEEEEWRRPEGDEGGEEEEGPVLFCQPDEQVVWTHRQTVLTYNATDKVVRFAPPPPSPFLSPPPAPLPPSPLPPTPHALVEGGGGGPALITGDQSSSQQQLASLLGLNSSTAAGASSSLLLPTRCTPTTTTAASPSISMLQQGGGAASGGGTSGHGMGGANRSSLSSNSINKNNNHPHYPATSVHSVAGSTTTDTPLRPELGLRLLWSGGASCCPSSSVVAWSSPAHPHLLGLIITPTTEPPPPPPASSSSSPSPGLLLLALSLSKASPSSVVVQEAFTLPCRAAVGVRAVTGGQEGAEHTDLLALTHEHTLVLYRGAVALFSLSLHLPPPPPSHHGLSSSSSSSSGGGGQLEGGANDVVVVTNLRDAVADRVTLEVQQPGGGPGTSSRMVRVSLGLDVSVWCPLTASVLGTLEAVAAHYHHHHHQGNKKKKDHHKEGDGSGGGGGGGAPPNKEEEEEEEALVLLMSVMGALRGDVVMATQQQQESGGAAQEEATTTSSSSSSASGGCWTALALVLEACMAKAAAAAAQGITRTSSPLLGQEQQEGRADHEAGGVDDEEGDDAFGRLMGSGYHVSYMEDNRNIVACLAASRRTVGLKGSSSSKGRRQQVGTPSSSSSWSSQAATALATAVVTSGGGSRLLSLWLSVLVEAVHLVAQDAMANTLRWKDLGRVSGLLVVLARGVGMADMADYYSRFIITTSRQQQNQCGALSVETVQRAAASCGGGGKLPPALLFSQQQQQQGGGSSSSSSSVCGGRPLSLDEWVQGLMLTGGRPPLPSPLDTAVGRAVVQGGACRSLRRVVRFYQALVLNGHDGNDCGGVSTSLTEEEEEEEGSNKRRGTTRRRRSREEAVVLSMVEEGLTAEDLATLPVGLALPLHEALITCRKQGAAADRWPAAASRLMGREDLAGLPSRPLPTTTREGSSSGRRRRGGQGAGALALLSGEGGGGDGGGDGGDASLSRRLAAAASAEISLLSNMSGGGVGGGPGPVGAAGRAAAMSAGAPGAAGASRAAGMAAGSRGRRAAAAAAAAAATANAKEADEENDADGLRLVEEEAALRFGRDRRMREVCRLLRTSKPLFLSVDRPAEISDHDFVQRQQAKLLLLCKRALATPVARGMLTLGTLRPLLLAEPLPVPIMSLSGRVPPTNAIINLDTSAYTPDLHIWPEFHNGVAAGLRLAPPSGGGSSAITRTWIIYNRPEIPSHFHGGLLLALGLQGHLKALAVTDLFDYLTQGHDPTTVAVFLGMAASHRGSADLVMSKTLCLHLPSLLAFPDVEVSSVAQSAALTGIGLLYQGTAHRLMTEFLLGEMSRRPTSDRIMQDREAYTLSAGLALGLVTLATGGRAKGAGLADLKIEERLHRLMVGGRQGGGGDYYRGEGGPPYDHTIAGTQQQHHHHQGAGQAGGTAGAAGGEASKCSRISEGEYINTDVTAPGATLALGLMFLRSNNAAVASRLSLPDTHFFLDYPRHYMLLLRVLARSLVMWDSVQPSSQWIQEQVPPFIQRAFDRLTRMGATGRQDDDDDDDDNEDGDEEEEDGAREGSSSRRGGGDVDWQSIRQAHANIMAGACLSMGLRYAGTACQEALEAIMCCLTHFRRLRDSHPVHDPAVAPLRPERPILEMCLGCVALSVGLVMAGTGDLRCFRVLRELRWRLDAEVSYGNHMALHMAIGLLFLGGGRATLGRSNEQIAALVLTLYPHFPAHTGDNQYTLQALRHLYVLAVEQRGVEAVDVGSKQAVYMPIEVTLKDGTIINKVAPCLLPELDLVSRVRTVSDRYYPLDLHLADNPHYLPLFRGTQRRILVKRKPGHLPYATDPQALSSLLVRPYHHRHKKQQSSSSVCVGEGMEEEEEELVSSAFTADPYLRALAKHYHHVEGGGQQLGRGGSSEESGGVFLSGVLYECLTKDKPEMLALHLGLRGALAQQGLANMAPHHAAATVRNLRLVLTYYSKECRLAPPPAGGTTTTAALQEDLMASLRVRLDDLLLHSHPQRRRRLASYLQQQPPPQQQREKEGGGDDDGDDDKEQLLFNCLLLYMDVPSPTALAAAIGGAPPHSSSSGGSSMMMRQHLPRLRAALPPHVPLSSLLATLKAVDNTTTTTRPRS